MLLFGSYLQAEGIRNVQVSQEGITANVPADGIGPFTALLPLKYHGSFQDRYLNRGAFTVR